MKKRIVLCADDYGQAPSISQGIIQLIQHKRLSAASCMVNTVDWPAQARQLTPFYQHVDIGLHFNLTLGKALSPEYARAHDEKFMSLQSLLCQAFLRRLNPAAIEAECHAQLDRFEAAMGFLPDFMDGHQHVHQFPVIRDAVIAVHQQRLPQAYVRSVYSPIHFSDIFRDTKKVIIYASGATAMERLLRKYLIRHNLSFAGIYDFQQAYVPLFPAFLRVVQDGGLIMCHPGLPAAGDDEIAEARSREYQYFISDKFLNDCEAAGVEISRFVNRP